MTSLFEEYKIILGSGSSRRKELLEAAGLVIDVVVKDHKEVIPLGLHGHEIAVAISKQKAEAYKPIYDDNVIVITADTIVLYRGEVLGKPSDRDEAIAMIKKLSGKTHRVVTGVTLLSSKGEISFHEMTEVSFERMSDDIICYYVDTYKPYDKAGAYGIQEWIGTVACSKVKGSYMNVIGMPVERVLHELEKFIK
ncbi:MAG: septum formation protein Maf [Bacteroidales bacterium]|nr:septum formation protein Maf [Bacteroidales bacterium]